MQFRIIGPVEVLASAGTPVPLGPPKQRTLLALLLTRVGELVTLDHLIDELWPVGPPRSAVANVRTYIASIRRLLAEHDVSGASLDSRGPAYRLDVDAGEWDLDVLRRRVDGARHARATGSLDRAVEELAAALSLWRGQPFQDVPLGPSLTSARTALDEEFAILTEDYAALLQDTDQPEAVLSMLRRHTATHPLRERGWALLMTALRRIGDTAGALAAFADARAALVDQLGIEPGRELQDLHRALLSGLSTGTPADQSGDGAVSSPVRPPAPVVTHAPAQLPVDTRGFIGRTEQLARLDALLMATAQPTMAIAVVSGTAGVGKTALAVH